MTLESVRCRITRASSRYLSRPSYPVSMSCASRAAYPGSGDVAFAASVSLSSDPRTPMK